MSAMFYFFSKAAYYREWNNWAEWTTCNKTCGSGFQSRQRECEPQTDTRTLYCLGESVQEIICNNCPCSGRISQHSNK